MKESKLMNNNFEFFPLKYIFQQQKFSNSSKLEFYRSIILKFILDSIIYTGGNIFHKINKYNEILCCMSSPDDVHDDYYVRKCVK